MGKIELFNPLLYLKPFNCVPKNISYIELLVSRLATIVEGNPKAPFSIAPTGEGTTPFPGLLHFTLDPYLIILSVKQGGIKYHFLSLWYDSTWDWTQVSRAIGKHSNHYTNVRIKQLVLHENSWNRLTVSKQMNNIEMNY